MKRRDPEAEAEKRHMAQLTGMGLQFAGGTVGLGALGWWIDTKAGTAPWGLIIGGLIGVVGGMYLMIRDALAAQRDADKRWKARQENRKTDPDSNPPQNKP